jgi:hypothetical protein
VTFEPEDARLFFYEAITEALGRLHLNVEHWTEFYLAELLTRQVDKPVPEQPLVSQLQAAVSSSTTEQQLLRFREMGGSALFLVGFCEAAVSARGVNRGYVMHMGGYAYRSAASLSEDGMSQVYVTLSDGFDDFAQVLDEVREMTSLRTQQDILKLYEKWRRTGSIRDAQKLQKAGVHPTFIKLRT